jgi:hypothetical protein
MSDELSQAGKLLSGKEGERSPQELAGITRKSRLDRHIDLATTSSVATESVVATKCDDKETHDEYVTDVLARFGIQI